MDDGNVGGLYWQAFVPAIPAFQCFPRLADLRPLIFRAFSVCPRASQGVFSENKQCLVIFYDGRLKHDGLKPSSFRNGRGHSI